MKLPPMTKDPQIRWAVIPKKHRKSYGHCPDCDGPMAKTAYRCINCSPLIRGQNTVMWKGDDANPKTKRERARSIYPKLGKCEQCRKPAQDRHHVDGDPGNNDQANIMFLCRRCHMELDGRLEAFKSKRKATADPKPVKRYRASAAQWAKMREELLPDRCAVCGERWATDLHHIYPRGQGGDDVTANLIAVDRSCHAKIEAHNPQARSLIRQALMPSNLAYLRYKLGENTEGWLSRNYPLGTYTHNALGLDLGLNVGLDLSEVLL